MASIGKVKTASGIRRYIQLSPGENESRPRISLGRITKKQADTAKRNIENLIRCNNTGAVMAPAVQNWLDGISDGLRKRLEILSIIEQSRDQGITITEWISRYIDKRTDVKEGTKLRWQDVERRLTVFFKDQPINKVTVERAKNFRIYLKTVCNLSENSVRRMIGFCRQFFNAAIDAEIINKNPFRGKEQPVSVKANPAKFFYVTPEIAQKALEACPDAEWRLIFGLARWGGLRCPSEVLRLKWQDVDFDNDRFTVHASKTEHHAGAGIRTVPMFPELRPLFLDAYDGAQEGDVYCVSRHRKVTSFNMKMISIVQHAGIEPWPKIFQNLRSTRETELFKMTNGHIKAVCTWIGNSPAVAMAHYAQVTEADEREAARLSVMERAVGFCQEKGVQNTVQTTAVPSRRESHKPQEEPVVSPYSCESKREFAGQCEKVQKSQIITKQDDTDYFEDYTMQRAGRATGFGLF
jgi:integrase